MHVYIPINVDVPAISHLQVLKKSRSNVPAVKSKDFLTENVEKEQYSVAVISATYLKEMYS
jgi:hypothetical protein